MLQDHHVIETPEQMPLQLEVAGIGSRFLAIAIDTMIQIAVGLAAVLVLFLIGAGRMAQIAPDFVNWYLGAMIVLAFLLLYGYYAIFEVLWNGQTPGKRIIGIRVVKDTGRPLTAGETIGRNLMRVVDQLPAFYGIGCICALCTKQHKRLGDLLVGAILVRENKLQNMQPVWHASQSASETPIVTTGLTAADLALIDAFLSRRESLDGRVRRVTATQILDRLKTRLPEDADLRGTPESVLEALSVQMRSSGRLL
jgi:uncharacterized RDD family membrane protein YckC